MTYLETHKEILKMQKRNININTYKALISVKLY